MADQHRSKDQRPWEQCEQGHGHAPFQQRPATSLEIHEARRTYLRNRAHSIGVESLVTVDLVDLVARLEEAKRTAGQRGDVAAGIAAADRLINLELAIKGLLAVRWEEEEP